MDPKTWMREALTTGAFAGVDTVTVHDLARGAQVALRLGRDQARQCQEWATEVLAEPRAPRHERLRALGRRLTREEDSALWEERIAFLKQLQEQLRPQTEEEYLCQLAKHLGIARADILVDNADA